MVKVREKKIWLFGVFCACPLNYPLNDCIFKEFRKLSALEKWEYVDSLSETEVDAYISHHRECLYKRELGIQKLCRSCNKIKKTV